MRHEVTRTKTIIREGGINRYVPEEFRPTKAIASEVYALALTFLYAKWVRSSIHL